MSDKEKEQTGAEAAVEAKDEAQKNRENAEKKPIKRPPYYVADGKAVTSKVGMLAPGAEVKADFLGGGEESLKRLVSRKLVIKS